MDLAYDLAHVQTLRQVLSQDLRLFFRNLFGSETNLSNSAKTGLASKTTSISLPSSIVFIYKQNLEQVKSEIERLTSATCFISAR